MLVNYINFTCENQGEAVGGGLGQRRVQKHAETKGCILLSEQDEKNMWQDSLNENKRLLMI